MWILEVDVPYEGTIIEDFDTAEAAYKGVSYYPKDYNFRIRLYTPTYEPWEIKEMLDEGIIK